MKTGYIKIQVQYDDDNGDSIEDIAGDMSLELVHESIISSEVIDAYEENEEIRVEVFEGVNSPFDSTSHRRATED